MKRQTLIILILLLILFISCRTKGGYVEKRNLSEFKSTEILPTLENNISNNSNSIYCSTLLYAWGEVAKEIKDPLEISEDSKDLLLLSSSKSYLGTLDKDEYISSGVIIGNKISAKAEFSKSLPFDFELNCLYCDLKFKGKYVSAFGGFGYEEGVSKIIKILYYKNDSNFIIKLLPKESNHEIFLFMSEQRAETLGDWVKKIDQHIKIGQQEFENEDLRWKYSLEDDDIVSIPKFDFNIETHFTSLENKKFIAAKQTYEIETVLQKIAFVLDEKGAKIESKAELDVLAAPPSDDEPRPKKLLFDKPFFLMLKRTDSNYPYFAMWVDNGELFRREEEEN
jgi:hypothetical protein